LTVTAISDGLVLKTDLSLAMKLLSKI